MDWPTIPHPFLGDDSDDFNEFDYDNPLLENEDFSVTLGRDENTEVLQRGAWNPLRNAPLRTDAEWSDWIEKLQNIRATGNDKDMIAGGFELLLSSPVELDMALGPPGIVKPHLSLPISFNNWTNIVGCFHLHNAVIKAMRAEKPYSGFVVKNQDDDMLEMFTAVMTSTDKPLSLSVSSTYFPKSRLSMAVFFSCSSEQKNLIESLLEGSPETSDHPLLVPGLFAELQRHRLEQVLLEVLALSEMTMYRLEVLEGVRTTGVKREKLRLTWKRNDRIRESIIKAKRAEEEARFTKSQLLKMTKDIMEKSRAVRIRRFRKQLGRFQRRFDEINVGLDDMMAQCRLIADSLTYAQNLVGAPVYPKVTIFAMPVFDFKNHWWDWRFQMTKESNGTSSADGGKQDEKAGPQPVLSGHFWIYLGISLVLTLVTLSGYCWHIMEPFSKGSGGKETKEDEDTGAQPDDSADDHRDVADTTSTASVASYARVASSEPDGHTTAPTPETERKPGIFVMFKSWISKLRSQDRILPI
ncbi:hypothetical protein QBC35DRAFT_538948 [Podospora australis]|uniref:Uncharacterized protein n=1 Tax=Podospora australis TaxID=1536484 RepID=A0AAN6WZ93_9PEZI|nr:hypothetical protein QBC35DRAFT_538948 [Podospora australis]